MAIEFPDFSYLAEENPAQYMEILNALQHIEQKTEADMAAYYAQQMAKMGADYEVLPNPAGHVYIDTGTRIAGGYNSPISSSTQNALELAHDAYDYEVLDVNGSSIYKSNMGSMKTTSQGNPAYQSTSILSMDVGIVGAALAPLFGVALGADLYERNPKFWTQLSQKLLPFCYPGTTEIPGWIDIVESAIPGVFDSKVVIDSRIVETVGDFIGNVQPVIPEYITTGSVVFSSNLPFNQILGLALSKIPTDYVVNDAVINAMSNLVSSNPNSAITIQVNIKSNTFNGSGFLWFYVFPSVVVGGTINLATSKQASYLNVSAERTTAGGTVTLSSTSSGTSNTMVFTGETATSSQYKVSSINIEPGELPAGTNEWEGNDPSLSPYGKKIIYMKKDPENPNQFIIDEEDGNSIALPKKSAQPESPSQLTRPENWPEGEDWPMTVDFPWDKPDDYTGDWPATMPWPLPVEKPEWWPDIIPYPQGFPRPAPSVDPDENPDPNQNADSDDTLPYVDPYPKRAVDEESGIEPSPTYDPSDETAPDPDNDPTDPLPPIAPVEPIDPPNPPGTTDPPPDDGQTPLPVVPTIPLPWTPAATGADGLITVYHPTDAQLKSFASWLWVTYADPSIDKLWNNPFDGVIGLMEIYCTPTDIGTKTIRSGFLDSGVSSQTISRYTEIDCGSITISEYYGNYLDYSPYSKCHAYLPFIGIVELNVDDIVGHAININYKIDEYNGSCIAQITTAKVTEVNGEEVEYSALLYQFSGNCAVELPLAGGTQSAIRAGLIQAAAYGLSSVIGGVVSGLSGNIGGAVSQIGYGAANAIGSAVSAKSSVQHSGSFGSSFGAMGIKTPFIIVTRPKQIDIINYPKLYGYPAHSAVTIGSCHGYLRVREVNVRSATASDEEKKRIEELLKEGVYID